MDMKKLKKMFPIFQIENSAGGFNPLIYLDTAATSQKPQIVIDAITDFYSNRNATVHRGIYDLSEHATEDYEAVREKVAKFINAADCSEIIFTSGTTEGINFIASAWAQEHLKEGDEIVVTQAEHHANLLPWQRVAKKTGAKLRFIELDKKDFLLKDLAKDLINKNTKLVALVHTSNVLGNIYRPGQLESIIKQAHKVDAKVLLDSAQTVPHQKIDVQKLGVDFLAFSAHKMCGPTGFGVLYIKKDLHDEVEPYQLGGSMVHDVTFESAKWQKAPGKFEAGTPPIAQVIGFGATIDFFNKHVDFPALHEYEKKLCSLFVDKLAKMDKVSIMGNREALKECGHLVTFTVAGIHAHDIAALLNDSGICVRAGHHCVQPLAKLFCIESSVRASFYMYNDEDDVRRLVSELREIIKRF